MLSQTTGHSIFIHTPSPKKDVLKFHTPRTFTSRCSPSDIQILCDFRASNPSGSNPWICSLEDFEALGILTSFESQKEATPWIFPENGNMGTPWIYSSLEVGVQIKNGMTGRETLSSNTKLEAHSYDCCIAFKGQYYF